MQEELEAVMGQFGGDSGTIHLLEGRTLVLKAHMGVPPQVLQVIAKIPVGKGMAGLAVERDEPVSSCNIQVDETGTVQPGAKQTGINGAVVVPIRDQDGNVVGTLGIGVNREYEFSAVEVTLLTRAASGLARLSMAR
jgi:L-methionine (R)-S-oxide reductase